jgi:hypothetical protein
MPVGAALAKPGTPGVGVGGRMDGRSGPTTVKKLDSWWPRAPSVKTGGNVAR